MKLLGNTFRRAADRFDPPTKVIRLEPVLGEIPQGIPQINFTTTVSRPQRRAPVPMRRSYAGAANSNVLANWLSSNTSGDAELRGPLQTLINRWRDLQRNNPHAEAFLRAVEQNIVGPNGFTLQSKVTELRKVDGKWATLPDKTANSKIEEAWAQWSKPKNCSASGGMSLPLMERLIARTVARDGSVLVRKIRGKQAGKYGLKLQLLEIDHLDLQKFETLPNGNSVRFGIELDSLGQPVSYRIFTTHPGDTSIASRDRMAVTVPASEIIHIFLPKRISQCIGEPWLVSAMNSLQMLGKLEEYALIASMVGASKMGFFVNTGDGADAMMAGTESEDGTFIEDAVPGAFAQLPRGWDFKGFDPAQPNESNAGFAQLILREIAAGGGCAYTTISGDLTGTNYSSARVGLLDERQLWMTLQNWLIESFAVPIFEEFLSINMLNRNIELPFEKFDKFNNPSFSGRRWPWVDPVSDAQALDIQIALGVNSRSRYCAEQGIDFEENLAELQKETDLAKEAGVTIVTKDPLQNAKLQQAQMGVDSAPTDNGKVKQ